MIADVTTVRRLLIIASCREGDGTLADAALILLLRVAGKHTRSKLNVLEPVFTVASSTTAKWIPTPGSASHSTTANGAVEQEPG